MSPNTLYSQTVEVSVDYLGPAGERFIRRQISAHLQIEPEKLQHKHMSKLVKWSCLAFALLTKDSRQVDEFRTALLSLNGTQAR